MVVQTLIFRFSYLVSKTTPRVFFSRFSTNFSIQIPICFPARSKWVSAHPTYSPYTTPPLLPTYPFIPLLWSPPLALHSVSPPFFCLHFSSPLPPPPSFLPFSLPLSLPHSPLPTSPLLSSLLSFHTLPLTPLPLTFSSLLPFSFPPLLVPCPNYPALFPSLFSFSTPLPFFSLSFPVLFLSPHSSVFLSS